jgi:hypothetical protein
MEGSEGTGFCRLKGFCKESLHNVFTLQLVVQCGRKPTGARKRSAGKRNCGTWSACGLEINEKRFISLSELTTRATSKRYAGCRWVWWSIVSDGSKSDWWFYAEKIILEDKGAMFGLVYPGDIPLPASQTILSMVRRISNYRSKQSLLVPNCSKTCRCLVSITKLLMQTPLM